MKRLTTAYERIWADGSAEMDYPTFEKKAAANSIKILKQLIKNL